MVPGTKLKPSRAKINSSYVEFYIVKCKQRRNHKTLSPARGSSRHDSHLVTQESLSSRAQRPMGQKVKQSSMRESCLLGRQGNDGGGGFHPLARSHCSAGDIDQLTCSSTPCSSCWTRCLNNPDCSQTLENHICQTTTRTK